MQGKMSPDGRFIAYASYESGRYEVYVRNFPDSGAKWQVSTEGGSEPIWRADGRELFYVRADRKLMALPVSLTNGFEGGAARVLFEVAIPGLSNPYRSNYAAARDGQRVLINAV